MQAPPIRLPKLEVRLETREPVEPPSEQQPRTEAQETPVDVVEFQQPVKIRRAESVKGPAAPIERVVAASEVKQAPTNVVPTRVATAVMASAGRETADPVTEIKAARNLAAVMAATAGEFTPLRMKRPSALQVASVSGEAEGTNEAVEVASLQQGLPVGQRTVGRPATRPVGSAAQPSDIETEGLPGTAGARNTGGKAVVLTAGVEGPGQMPELHGVGESAVLLAKYPGRGARFRMNAPGKLDVPSSFGDTISSQLFRAPGKLSPEVVEALGGSGETQAAIGRALDWFSKNQEPDGRWDIEKHAGERGHDMAATALTLLCFYGWGAKHTEEGGHNEAVRKALNWLLSQMKDDGALYSGQAPRNNWMYDHGMATIALCEAYGLSKDPALLGPAKRAVQFIIDAQNPQTHGWRYLPRQDADTSVFGWHYMALRSARLAGIDVPEEVFLKANKWLDRVGGGQHGGIYGYQGPDASRPAMIATGMFCRQLAGVRRTDPKMQEGALYMRGHPILAEPMNYYYLYYGTLALYQHQGEIWEDWNKRMKEILLSLQDKTGADAGSWPAVRDWHGERMGRVVTTAMATLSLEVYYRLLPLYGFHFLAETPEDGAAAGKPTDATAKEPAER
jgi:hypothetical protein